MPLRGRARTKKSQEVDDLDFYSWWKALVSKGISPSEAWAMDFLESSIILELEPISTDVSLAIYHQRKANGAPECLQKV
jgi:hypothetical protein